MSPKLSRIGSWIERHWVPVALNLVYSWLHALQGWRSSLKKNRKSFCPFVSFLLLMPWTQVDTFCCFITSWYLCVYVCMSVCVCLDWPKKLCYMLLVGYVCHDFENKDCNLCSVFYFIFYFFSHNLKPWAVSCSQRYSRDSLGTCVSGVFLGVCNCVYVCPTLSDLCFGLASVYCWACHSLSQGAQIAGFISGWTGMSSTLFLSRLMNWHCCHFGLLPNACVKK